MLQLPTFLNLIGCVCGTNEKIFVSCPLRLPQLSGHKVCGYPKAETVPQEWLFFIEAEMGRPGRSPREGVSVFSRKEGGCFLQNSPCESREPGAISAAPGQGPVVPHPHESAAGPPPQASSLNRSQSGWEGAKGIGSTLTSDPISQIN